MFYSNPEYVPGGVQNFWTRARADTDGLPNVKDVKTQSAATAEQDGARSSFFAGFFTNPMAGTEVETKKEEAGKGKEKRMGLMATMPRLNISVLDFYALPPLNGSY